MTLTQKITRLQSLLEQAKEHQTKLLPDPAFVVWKEHVLSSLGKIMGLDAPQTVKIVKLSFTYSRPWKLRGVDYSEVDRLEREAGYKRDMEIATGILQNCLADLSLEAEEGNAQPVGTFSLAYLHPTVQQAAGSRFMTSHHSDAILAACIALDKAVQAKAQRPNLNGKQLMDVAFTPNSPLVCLSQDRNEQMGFMLLYQGVIQAIRNHYAHNDSAVEPARAMEWLGFISALFYKLDEAALPSTISNAL